MQRDVDARRGRGPHRRARHGPAALQHRPVRRRGAAGPRGGPRADPAAGAGAGDRAVRRHPDRLPALARPADRQRADRLRRRDRAAGVRVLRAARRRAAQDHDRQGPGAAQPQARDRRRARHHVRRPHPAQPRGHGAAGRRRGATRSSTPSSGAPSSSPTPPSPASRSRRTPRPRPGADSYRQLAKEVLARCLDG